MVGLSIDRNWALPGERRFAMKHVKGDQLAKLFSGEFKIQDVIGFWVLSGARMTAMSSHLRQAHFGILLLLT